MTNVLPLIGLAALAGVATATQAPTNALLSRSIGSPVSAAFISFLVGTLVLAPGAWAVARHVRWNELGRVPPSAWLGGLYGAFFVTVAAYAAPRIGAAALLTSMVAGQMVTALVLDRAGLFGLSPQAITPARLLGVALVLIGVLLVQRG